MQFHCIFSTGLVMLDGYIFAVGGRGGEESRYSMEKYDPRTDTWELMESVVLGMKEHYCYTYTNVVALDGHLYFIGMEPNTCRFRLVYVQHNGSLTMYESFVVVIIIHASPVDIESCLMFVSSWTLDGTQDDRQRGQVVKYNPKTSVWTEVAPMQITLSRATACVLNGKIYILGLRESIY